MLQMIIGKAGTGKTARMMSEIAARVEGGCRSILIVPEQYSHQAERELCAMCGDSVSLFAEVLTFTGFARRIDRELGSGEPVSLDKGGQLLCMALALDMIYSQLRMYGGARRRAALQSQLLEAVTECKIACVPPEALLMASDRCEGVLRDKLHDLALVLLAYDTVVSRGRADPTDKLTRLAERLEAADVGDIHFYIDGFTDFTGQQLRVIDRLLGKGCDVTVALTSNPYEGGNEMFAIPDATSGMLVRIAHVRGVKVKVLPCEPETPATPLAFYCDHLFSYPRERMEDPQNTIRLYTADSMGDECAFAAAKCIELVRDTGCRWRDIAVAVRGFDAYELQLTAAFRKYGVPLYLTKRTSIMEKPLVQLIASAYEIISGGWDPDDVFGYLRTGLTGMETDDCDLLESYVLLWNLRGNAWIREGDWRMHPKGYEENYSPADEEVLRRVNVLRRRVAAPLKAFGEEAAAASDGHGQVMALVHLLEALGVDRLLAARADGLEAAGYPQQAEECEKLWEITMTALEQFDSILGDTETATESFSRLFLLMLNQYDVGTIPIGVDCVGAGELDRMRRRNLRHLIVLGADDEHLPSPAESSGVFTVDDRSRLLEAGLDLGTCGEAELWREFGLIYNCLALPKESLSLCYCASGGARPSIVFNRAVSLFDKTVERVDVAQCRAMSHGGALELAAFSLRDGAEPMAAAAAEYFRETDGQRLELLYHAAERSRGSLSAVGVRNLYGDTLRLSASRIDRFNQCPFSYFMEYGLKAKPRKAAAFAPPEMGTFMHYVLEHVAKDVGELGGFPMVSDETLQKLTDKYISEYISRFLNDFKEKTPRFVYLFRRLTKDVRAVVSDMAAELRKSSFVPLDFELNFGDEKNIPPMVIGEGEASLTLTGIADRVDGWVHDGKLYLRVVDYKTGKKEFTLSDVWYGMNLQMLLYLFTLEKFGEQRYGMEVVPAGVLYVPAFHKNVVGKENLTDEEIAAQQQKKHLRSGLLLHDEAVLQAMEAGSEYEFLPIAVKKRGSSVPDALATAQQLGVLAGHIEQTLQKLAAELGSGSIAAAPSFKNAQNNACAYCAYKEMCGFEDGERGEHCRPMKNLPTEQVWTMMEGEREHG